MVFDFAGRLETDIRELDEAYQRFEKMPERSAADYYTRRTEYEKFRDNIRLRNLRLLADAQVAQFYLAKTTENRGKHVTHDTFSRWMEGLNPIGPGIAAAMTVAQRKRFGHWFIDFWDVVDAGGFDLIIGNPPYLGDKKLSGSYGHAFCEWVKWEYAPAGLSDLVVYFLRRIYDLLRSGGFTALITTNSIKDGDVRSDGLEQVVKQGGSLTFVQSSIRWPGVANLYVSLFCLHKGAWNGRPRSLDGRAVPFINTRFEADDETREPITLEENEERMFTGFIYLGEGFILLPGEAEEMIRENPELTTVIFPTINGQEVNNTPDQQPSRQIINFFDWPIEKASRYGKTFERVRNLVKPVRDADNRELYRVRWWNYAENRPGLRRALASLDYCFVVPQTGKHFAFSRLPAGWVFLQTLYVLASEKWSDFALVQSCFHEAWMRKHSGALKNDIRYLPTKCFLTFPFPCNPASESTLASIGENYHEHRRALMRDLWLGLTDLYNLFHDPALTPELVSESLGERATITGDEGFARIQRLRELHRELDQTVLTAYGWHTDSDFGPALSLRHDFHPLDFLPENDRIRFTLHPESRREVLARLLKLNHQRAAEAEQMQKQAPVAAPAKKKSKPKQPVVAAPPELDLGLDLFGRNLPSTLVTTPNRVVAAPSDAGERKMSPGLEEVVSRFDFSFPSKPRPQITTTAELFTLLLPSLVQEAGGQLDFKQFLEAMSFLAHPPKSSVVLPPTVASQFTKWRTEYPSNLVDANALKAALGDHIVMRRTLGILSDGDNFVLFKGNQWVDMTLDWLMFDARLALAHAAKAQTVEPTWKRAVAERDLKAWAVS